MALLPHHLLLQEPLCPLPRLFLLLPNRLPQLLMMMLFPLSLLLASLLLLLPRLPLLLLRSQQPLQSSPRPPPRLHPPKLLLLALYLPVLCALLPLRLWMMRVSWTHQWLL